MLNLAPASCTVEEPRHETRIECGTLVDGHRFSRQAIPGCRPELRVGTELPWKDDRMPEGLSAEW